MIRKAVIITENCKSTQTCLWPTSASYAVPVIFVKPRAVLSSVRINRHHGRALIRRPTSAMATLAAVRWCAQERRAACLPKTVQRLSIPAGYEQGLHMCSWPSAGGPPVIELFSMASLTLVDASSQQLECRACLAGCRVKVEAGQLTLVDTQLTEDQHAGMDMAGRLLAWINGSHAAAVMMEFDSDHAGSAAYFNVSVAKTLYHHNYAVGQEDYGVQSGQLLSALQLRCESHGLSCSPGDKAHSICISRIV